MSGFGSGYQSSGGGGGDANRLQKYSQNIGSNIQKITQNGKHVWSFIEHFRGSFVVSQIAICFVLSIL